MIKFTYEGSLKYIKMTICFYKIKSKQGTFPFVKGHFSEGHGEGNGYLHRNISRGTKALTRAIEAIVSVKNHVC